MSETQIYHNPRCSKSRETLALLEQHGVAPEVVLYLEQAPSEDEIRTLLSQLDGTELHSGRILGGKTGYTGEAGLCLASLAEVKGREYILVTAGAGGNHSTAPYHIEDAVTVYRRVSRGS